MQAINYYICENCQKKDIDNDQLVIVMFADEKIHFICDQCLPQFEKDYLRVWSVSNKEYHDLLPMVYPCTTRQALIKVEKEKKKQALLAEIAKLDEPLAKTYKVPTLGKPIVTQNISDDAIKCMFADKMMAYVEAHPDVPWDWIGISRNSNITMAYIEAHPDVPWDWDGISFNPNLTMAYVEAHPDKPWDWAGISYNLNLTMAYVEVHPDKPWDWDEISCNIYVAERKQFEQTLWYHSLITD